MRVDPVAELRRPDEVGGNARGGERGRRILAERGAVAERDVEQREQQSAVRAAARVGVLGQDAQPDDEPAVRLLAVEQRADRLEEGTCAEQRLESCRRTRLVLLHSPPLIRHPPYTLDGASRPAEPGLEPRVEPIVAGKKVSGPRDR